MIMTHKMGFPLYMCVIKVRKEKQRYLFKKLLKDVSIFLCMCVV